MRQNTGRSTSRQGSIPRFDPTKIFDDDIFDAFTDAEKIAITQYMGKSAQSLQRGGPPPPIPPAMNKFLADDDRN